MSSNSLSLESILDALATAIAGKLRDQLEGQQGNAVKPRLMSVNDAAVYLSRSPHSVRHLIDQGKLPTSRIDNRIFLDVKDLDRVIDESKQVE